MTLAERIIRSPWRTSLYCATATLAFIIACYQLFLLACVLCYAVFNPSSTAFMRAQQWQTGQVISQQWRDYAQLGNPIKRAVLASEDTRFFTHNGVEWEYIWKAFKYNLQQIVQGKPTRRGGSTITQQLAKNLFLSPSRSYFRKLQELSITYMLEAVMSKQRILELYLNTAEFGHNLYGAAAASQYYFKKAPAQLTGAQAARLAVLLPNPDYYGAHINGPYITRQSRVVVRRMGQVKLP